MYSTGAFSTMFTSKFIINCLIYYCMDYQNKMHLISYDMGFPIGIYQQ